MPTVSQRSAFRPGVEGLEERTLPSVSLDGVAVPDQVRQGVAVSLSAAATDPEGGPVTYLWDFGDGTTTSGVGLTSVTHTYAAPGLAIATVTAADQAGNQDSWTGSVQVRTPQSLIVGVGGNQQVTPGSAVTFSGTISYPGGGIDPANVAWDMNYSGDIFNPTVTGTLSPTYTFGSPGVYKVAVKATDPGAGVCAMSTTMVTVGYAGPTITVGPDLQVTVGQPFTLSGSYTNSDGTVDPSGVEWDFDYDGVTFSPDASGTLSPTTQYDRDGGYTVMLQVTDNHGVADFGFVRVTAAYAAAYVHLSGPDAAVPQNESGTSLSAIRSRAVHPRPPSSGTSTTTASPSLPRRVGRGRPGRTRSTLRPASTRRPSGFRVAAAPTSKPTRSRSRIPGRPSPGPRNWPPSRRSRCLSRASRSAPGRPPSSGTSTTTG